MADNISPLLNATPPSLRGAPAFGAALPLRVSRRLHGCGRRLGVVRVNITALE